MELAENKTCYGYLLPCNQECRWMPITQNSNIGSYLYNGYDPKQLSSVQLKINSCRVYINNLNIDSSVYVNGAQIIDAVLNDGDVITVGNNELVFFKNKIQIGVPESQTPSWKKELSLLHKYATTKHPILLVGESGTGKDIIARYIHQNSNVATNPL